MVYCSAVGCNSNSNKKDKPKEISFHRLPREESLRKVWLANLKRENPPPEKNIRICSLHFDHDQLELDLKVRFCIRH